MMRKALIILFSLPDNSLSATDYYVKSTGNDSNTDFQMLRLGRQLLRSNTVWAAVHLLLVIIFISVVATLLRNLTVTESGTSANNIHNRAYGTGNNPILRIRLLPHGLILKRTGFMSHSLSRIFA